MAQGIAIIFFIPFYTFIFFTIVIKNPSFEGMVFLIICSAIIFFIINRTFRMGDILFVNDTIIIKKLFNTCQRKTEDIKEINSYILSNTFYFEFTDLKRIYFYNNSNNNWQTTLKEFKEILSSKINTY